MLSANFPGSVLKLALVFIFLYLGQSTLLNFLREEVMASNTSQQNEEGYIYSSRHEHYLCWYEGLQPYTCSGCKEYGANFGYKCSSCPEFILHEACTTIPDEYTHPLYSEHPFQFRFQTRLRHHCDGCGEVLRGFVFESPSRDLRLHPLCMALPKILTYGGHEGHRLELVIEEGKYSCTRCNNARSGWKYQCEETACRLWVDLNCAKVDFHGLSEHGISSISRRSRSKHVMEKLSKSGKFVAGKVIEGTVAGFIGASLDLN